MLTLLLGGARSGKSTLAVQMAERQHLPVVFVATAEGFDDDKRLHESAVIVTSGPRTR